MAFKFLNMLSTDLGIDLGTANSLIHVRGKGIVVDEPSIIALDGESDKVVAIGNDAREMLGRTHRDIIVIRPLKDGVIADFEATEIMMRELIRKANINRMLIGKIVVDVPSGITEVEKRAVRDSAERAGVRPRRRGPPPAILGDPYVRALSLMILLIFVTLTIGDYQFKRIARDAYQEDALARFFSLFYAGTGIVSFVFQIVLTPRILARFGVGAGMTVMPSVFGAFSAALLFGPRLAVATVMKFADNGFQYTIHETTLQALYVPFAAEVKARTRALLDAVVKPLSYGAGGIALVVLVPVLEVHELSFATVPLVVGWLALVPLVRRRYLRSLEATLSARGALALETEDFLDAGGRRALLATLEHGEPRQVLVALEQVAGERHTEVRDAVARLTGHPDSAVRTAALYQVAATAHGDRVSAQSSLSHTDPDVRAAAAAAFAALAEDESIETLQTAFDDPHPDVRVAALKALAALGETSSTLASSSAAVAREYGRLSEITTVLRLRRSEPPLAPDSAMANFERSDSSGRTQAVLGKD